MRRILLILAGFLLVACQKSPDKMLLGIWKYETSVTHFYDTGDDAPAGSNCKRMSFKEGGIGYFNETPFTYTLNGNALRIVMPEVTNDYIIEELTAERLIYSKEFPSGRPHKVTTYFSRFE